MPESKTYILDDLPTDHDALDLMPFVETLIDVCKTSNTPLTIGVFDRWIFEGVLARYVAFQLQR